MTAYEQSMAELVRRVEALESASDVADQRLHRLENGDAGYEEQARQDRWHATYNAVLGGLNVGDDVPVHPTAKNREAWIKNADEMARLAADRAHGPLEQKP